MKGIAVEGVSAGPGLPAGLRRRPSAREQGAALVELAVVLPVLVLIVFATIDLGRAFRLSTRLENAAREGAATAQFNPLRVTSGCHGTANVADRVRAEDAGLESTPGFAVRLFKRDTATGSLVPPGGVSGCDTAPAGVTLSPGDRVVVQVEAAFEPLTPLVSRFTGTRLTLRGHQEVVVQG